MRIESSVLPVPSTIAIVGVIDKLARVNLVSERGDYRALELLRSAACRCNISIRRVAASLAAFFRACFSPRSRLATGSASAFDFLVVIVIVRGSPATRSRPLISSVFSSGGTSADPILILMSSAVRSPMSRYYCA